MKTHRPRLLPVILLTSILGLSASPARTWTKADGSSTFEGELVAYDAAAGKVTVSRSGKTMTFDQKLLSEGDLEFLKTEGTKLPPKPAASTGAPTAAKVSGTLPDKLPDPDGKEADMSKPVRVFIMMGQSNMLGFGNTGQLKGAAAEKYPYLVDDAGNWNVRKDVRNVFFCMGKLNYNDWLTAENGNGNHSHPIG